MRPIGFSTGALALSDFHRALRELQGKAVDCVELSALRFPELQPLVESFYTLDLNAYRYKGIHAPSCFDAEQEIEIARLLDRNVPRDWPIILHPDTIHDFSIWRRLGKRLAIEKWIAENR